MESTTFDWTTRLSLDIQRLAMSTSDSVVLSFFAGDKTVNVTPSLILQAFIQQIVTQKWGNFNGSVCYRQAVSIDRLHDCGDDFMKLWSIFAVCLDIAQVSCVFVVLDNIDGVLSRCKDSDKQRFFRFLQGLAHSPAPICKILATSRSNALPFTMRNIAHAVTAGFSDNNFSLLRIPRATQVGSDLVQKRQRYRMSIVGELIELTDDPMLADIAAEDVEKGEDHAALDDTDDEDIDAILNDNPVEASAKSANALDSGANTAKRTTQASVETEVDSDLSGLSDSGSDSGFDLENESQLLPSSITMNEVPKKLLEVSVDEVSDKVLSDSESDFNLSDLDNEAKPIRSTAKQKAAQRPRSEVLEDSDDDLNLEDV